MELWLFIFPRWRPWWLGLAGTQCTLCFLMGPLYNLVTNLRDGYGIVGKTEMDRVFSVFQTAASCSKWNKIRLGHRFVRCPSGHRPWTSVVLIVYQRYHNRHWLRDKAVCWWLCYREIKGTEDTVKLQEDIDSLGCWARKWGMRFQPVKCNIMQITRKRIKKIIASYNLEETVLDNVENIKYLGITITNHL